MTREAQISNQEYVLVKSATNKTTQEFGSTYNFTENSIGFQFLVLGRVFELQEDEIVEAITDTIFLQKLIGEDSGPDRGADAVQIEIDNKIIHIFNFKYTDKDIDKVRTSFFPSAEVNNIIVLIKDIFEKNTASFSGNTSNTRLEEKVKEIWEYQDKGILFKFQIHFVSNLFKGLTIPEDLRFADEIKNYRGDVSFDYILTGDISDKIISRPKLINSKIKAIGSNYFMKEQFNTRALVMEILAVDLLRITSDNENIRENVVAEYGDILLSHTEKGVFDDNVRVYLKQRTAINKNIKQTALTEEGSNNFFFYNNGITITCDKFDYQNTKNQIINLTNFQVVNGGQTINALRQAFVENQEFFDEMTVLCKIYETNDIEFKTRIAEYTNSQNPVSNRDIHAIDSVQIKLGEELKNSGYFYERKKNQFDSEDKEKRIDSEKVGQALLAFALEKPAEAKNKKSIIFGQDYNNIFNDNLVASKVLEVVGLYRAIEKLKIENAKIKPYLMHSSYYIMFFINKIYIKRGDISIKLMDLYEEAVEKIEFIISKEKERLNDDYLDAVLFKANRPKEYLAELGL